ncbi:MAG: hypothetical protein ABJB97_10160, partial [Acidobacteriota bacterium]
MTIQKRLARLTSLLLLGAVFFATTPAVQTQQQPERTRRAVAQPVPTPNATLDPPTFRTAPTP